MRSKLIFLTKLAICIALYLISYSVGVYHGTNRHDATVRFYVNTNLPPERINALRVEVKNNSEVCAKLELTDAVISNCSCTTNNLLDIPIEGINEI